MAGNSSNTYEVIVEQQGKTEALVFGSWQNWLVAFITLAIVVLLNHYGKGLFKLASILIGTCLRVYSGSLLRYGRFFRAFHGRMVPGPRCLLHSALSLIYQRSCLWRSCSSSTRYRRWGISQRQRQAVWTGCRQTMRLNGGIIGYGVSNIVGALFGCPPTATYSQNVGIVGSTRVCSEKSVHGISSHPAHRRTDPDPKFSALLGRSRSVYSAALLHQYLHLSP